MKKIFTFLVASILTVGLLAQVPQKMSYQAVIRDADNNLITNQTVGIQISILQGTSTGTVVYSENLNPTSNSNGLVTLEIGSGAGFAAIDWANGPYFIKTETDPSGGANYTITGTSQLLSVPYALHARSAETISEAIVESDPVFTAAFDLDGAQVGDLLQFDGVKWVRLTPDFAETDHAHPDVTDTEAGFMSAEDKIKLDELQNSDGSETIIVSGNNIIVTGEGTTDAPYVISATDGTEPGEMRYWDGSEWVAISPGESGLSLTLCNGVPVWGPCPGKATVNLLGVSNVTRNTAIASVHVVSDGGYEVTERGVCYSTSPNPTTENSKLVVGNGVGTFTADLSGLLPQTLYYVRGYAINSEGTSYSDQIGFTTLNIEFGSVTDSDNNVYKTITIGDQEWMAENLKTTKYTDGTAIANVTNNTEWNGLSTGGYSFYNNDAALGNAYGALYNWYAVENGVCPAGWRVPTDADWTALTNYIINNFEFGGVSVGRGLKSCRQIDSALGEGCATTEHPRWAANATYGTDNFGFAGLPSGTRGTSGNFSGVGSYVFFWSTTTNTATPTAAWSRALFNELSSVGRTSEDKRRGQSVRCVRD